MPKAIRIERFRSEGMAECEQCAGPPYEWTRERARIHADQQQHTVRFVIEDTTIYRPTLGEKP